MLKGSCACGRIRYETQAQVLAVNACHCKTCQQVSGGPFLGFVDFPTSELKWTRQPEIWASSDIAERGYCKVCGSSMSMRYHFEPERIGLCLGTVLEARPPLPGLSAHIFLNEKASYFVLPDDGASGWDEFKPKFHDKIRKWKQGRVSNIKANL
ncbi:uncharacterized protein Z518_00604 [Rhinocladiella mackenziei CBS 650.93]|uniref:CENP-V/GFA domain-containing protein n=1 Tax=Rhinocladiella mackenziei CBS 650.93 TaxID=1442369 RepID=A0A0D2ITY3_9EURO|nr:uncharacterized protein Z518_00604 [Rhinocladiella mackenziei CBS 650.93]KIX09524.1 hypothetical protein Z518_00604 [Rhinocladiella mackenziei CBS 650.93]